jgi:hypothetical protein
MKDMIQERERALENEFFAARERKLLEQLRAEANAESARDALARTTQIEDPALLDSLLAAGVRAETVALLVVVPLLFVAWGDHRMVDVERRAVRETALKLRVAPSGVTSEILEGWLDERPPENLFTAWKEWIRVLAGALPEDERARLAERIIGRCREVAHAAGGFLESGRPIEPGQRDVLEEIKLVFEEAGASS